MGYMRHDAIVVTSFDNMHLEKARSKAISLGLDVSEVVGPVINGYSSFFIAPDGSKEGWPESDNADGAREAWIHWANFHRNDLWLSWAHVSYGGDDPELAKLVDHSLGECYDDEDE